MSLNLESDSLSMACREHKLLKSRSPLTYQKGKRVVIYENFYPPHERFTYEFFITHWLFPEIRKKLHEGEAAKTNIKRIPYQ
jgi:hypothetical protein